jgi:hypothetical protein
MAANKYRKLILDTLEGKTPQLQEIPPQRLDWNGPGALLELYHRTSGKDRVAIIRAIGNIVREHAGTPPVLAQLIDIASALELAEVEPDVRALQSDPLGSQEPLRASIENFLAYRKMMADGQAPPAGDSALSAPPRRRRAT